MFQINYWLVLIIIGMQGDVATTKIDYAYYSKDSCISAGEEARRDTEAGDETVKYVCVNATR